MTAFDFNICFEDEPSLKEPLLELSKKSLIVRKSAEAVSDRPFPVESAYTLLSGREIKYFADRPYADCGIGCRWGIEVRDVVFVVWRCGEYTVTYTPLDSFTPKLLEFWVLHTILPLMLTLEDSCNILHVGAVEIDGEAVLFSALSYGGKSTLTDYFLRQGHRFFCDDTLGVYRHNGGFMAVPSYPYHRPYREVESLGRKSDRLVKSAAPVKAVLVLQKCAPDAAIVIEEIKGVEKYRSFYFSAFVNFDFLKKRRFKWMSELLDAVPVYRVKIPWDLSRLNELYQQIIKEI